MRRIPPFSVVGTPQRIPHTSRGSSSLGPRAARISARREWTSKIESDRNVRTFGEQAVYPPASPRKKPGGTSKQGTRPRWGPCPRDRVRLDPKKNGARD